MKTGKIEEIRIEEIEEMETDTMSKLEKVFDTPNKKAFIGFLTAGDPDADSTVQFILEMVKRVREQSQIPLAFMTYVNPVFHYGYEKFFTKCEELGISAIIIPDVPYEEKAEVEAPAKTHGVKVISMIAPTSESRIRQIASEAEGFIYVVSSMGVTGVRSEIKTNLPAIVESIRTVTDVPCAIGFGISTPEQAKAMASISDGAIVGSAIVKIIAKYGKDAAPYIGEYVKSMKEAVAE